MSFFKGLIDDRIKDVNPIQVITIALGLAIIVWGSHVAFHTHAMPNLAGIGEALGGTALANVAHKAEDIADKFKKPADVPPAA
jgi:hypothetical protein